MVSTSPTPDPNRKPPLTETAIIYAARVFYEQHNTLPNCKTKAAVPGMPDDSWMSIYQAGYHGRRGLEKGRTLGEILQPLRDELLQTEQPLPPLSEEVIRQAARTYYMENGKLPTRTSEGSLKESSEFSWKRINHLGQAGHRGLEKGRTLSKILKPLREELQSQKTPPGAESILTTTKSQKTPELTQTLQELRLNIAKKLILRIRILREKFTLTEDSILKAAEEFYEEHGKFPSRASKQPVPGLKDKTWDYIHQAAYHGRHGLTAGRTLSTILEPLKRKSGIKTNAARQSLSEEVIRDAAREFYIQYNKIPTKDTKEPVPGMKHETWKALDSAAYSGYRSLIKGQSLSKILLPLREEYQHKIPGKPLTEDGILRAAREFYSRYGKLPTCASQESAPFLSGDTWGAIDRAGKMGYRNLNKGRTLSSILTPLRVEYGLTRVQQARLLSEVEIIAAAKRFHHGFQQVPTKNTVAPVPGMEGETWQAIDHAGRYGLRGLTKGRTLKKILIELHTV